MILILGEWCKKIFLKWVWLIGVIPSVIGLVLFYVPIENRTPIIRQLAVWANFQFNLIFLVFVILCSSFLVYYDMKKRLDIKIEQLEIALSTNGISEKSIDISYLLLDNTHFIFLKYVSGEERIKVDHINQTYIDKNGEQKISEINNYFIMDGAKYAPTSLNILAPNEGVRFYQAASVEDTKDGNVTVNITFTGIKSGKTIVFNKKISLKPNNNWTSF